MGRTRSVVEGSSKANKSNGVGDAVKSATTDQLEWDAELNIYQRLVRAQHDAKSIKPSKGGSGLKYDFLAHDDVTAEAKSVLTKNGILFFPTVTEMKQDAQNTIITIECKFSNVDKPEECITTTSHGYGLDKQDKGPGKAYSYAVKFALQKVLMFNTGEDIENHDIEYTPAQIAHKTEAEIKDWFKALSDNIDHIQSYEQLKQLKTDNKAMLQSPAVPEKTKEAILEKLDDKIDMAKQALLQDEAE